MENMVQHCEAQLQLWNLRFRSIMSNNQREACDKARKR
jgi:hypothetical protein